ncbi:MAG: AAA family ATPase [Nannocystaceae bacterium]
MRRRRSGSGRRRRPKPGPRGPIVASAAIWRRTEPIRDFKPDNVLVGADGRVRVVDFGLARPLAAGRGPGARVDVEGQTIQAGNLAGTPGYMAPEQLREGQEVDARSDIFAFCITLWEALTGERPFGGATIADNIQHVIRGQLRPFPRDLGVPVKIVDALQRGLAVEPAARWQEIGELLKALRSAAGDDDVARSQVRPFDEGTSAAMPSTLGVRYRLIEPFAEGTLGPIFRAYDRLDGQRVAIKRTYALDLPRTGEVPESPRLALARELRGRFALRHPNLVSIVDFGFDDEDVAFFVLDLTDGARPLLSAAADAPRAIQVHLVGQLLRALIYLHRRGRVGLTLSHQNVVVSGESLKIIDTDWYIDAAISALHETLRPQGPVAPERSKGGDATVASDLYAVGVLMAALFAGVAAADASRQAALLSAVRAGSLERSFGVDGPLARFIGRLLDPDPSARPASAAAALEGLVAASGVELPAETVHTRESFLQAGALVGREGELEYLIDALRGSLRGRGRAIALGGESGVGKSRLISEVRTLGLVHGAVVLRGHAVSEGGRLFDAWRPLLRWLTLSSALSDLEASVLRIGVPDIDALLGRAVPSAPELDAASAQLRLLQVVVALLRRQVRPLVVLLEDVHWARSETVELLGALTRELEGLRLLIVASYRDDEAPRLFADDTGIERRRLGRLDRPAIREVVAATLGERGVSEALVELLVRETEGNALFVVEVLRTLAEDAGGLEGIGEQPLPTTIASGGIRRVIQRRIDRLSPAARELLELAAVIGRDLDVELLERLAPDRDPRARIAEAVDRAALEREGGGWRFAHDKIRETLLDELADARRRSLHAAVAEALEADDDRDQAEALAYHFRAIERPDKELVYVARAGERVIRASPREGAALLARAVELGRKHGATPLELARWRRKMADARYVVGEMSAAVDEARAALRAIGYGWPRSTLGWLVLLCTQLVVQALHVLRRPGGAAGERGDRLREAAVIAGRATQVYVYTFEQLPLIAAALRAVNLADRAGQTEPRSVAFLAYAAGLLGADGLAERYFAAGHAGAESSDDVAARCDLGVMAAVFATGRGDFARAVELGREAVRVARGSGFALGVAQAEGILGCVAYYRGDLASFHKSYKEATEAIRGSHSGHARGLGWALSWALAELGRDDEAMARNEAILAETPPEEKLHLSMVYSLRAVLMARRGRLTEAVEAADETMRHADVGSVPANTPVILAGPAEAYLAAWEAILGSDPGQAAALRKKAKAQLRAVRMWARLNPIGRPLVDLLGGRIAFLDGVPARAEASWTAALGQAEALQLRLWEGQAHLLLALHGDRRGRDRHRHAAEHTLRRCGALFRLGPLGNYRALLSSTPD